MMGEFQLLFASRTIGAPSDIICKLYDTYRKKKIISLTSYCPRATPLCFLTSALPNSSGGSKVAEDFVQCSTCPQRRFPYKSMIPSRTINTYNFMDCIFRVTSSLQNSGVQYNTSIALQRRTNASGSQPFCAATESHKEDDFHVRL